MNKFIALFVLALIPFSKAATQCGENPFYAKTKAHIAEHTADYDPTELAALNTALAAYETSAGATWTKSVSGTNMQCPLFADGTESCCNDELVKGFKTLVQGDARSAFKQPIAILGFLREFMKNYGRCADKSAADTFFQNATIQSFVTQVNTCRKNNVKPIVSFLRGNLCTLCFKVSDIDTYFTNGVLQVDQTNFANINTQIKATFDCFTDAQKVEVITALMTQYYTVLDTLPESRACTRFSQWMNGVIAKVESEGAAVLFDTIESSENCGQNLEAFKETPCHKKRKEKGEKFREGEFSPDQLKSQAQVRGADKLQGGRLQNAPRARGPQQQGQQQQGQGASRRTLSTATDYNAVSSGGYSVYYESSAADGTIVTGLQDSTTLGVEESDLQQQRDTATASSEIMRVGLLVVLSVLALLF